MKMTYIGGGHYRISDSDASRIAKANGIRLPRWGWLSRVVLADGKRGEILRTVYRHAYSKDAPCPKRGWVWAVMYRD